MLLYEDNLFVESIKKKKYKYIEIYELIEHKLL